MRPIRRFAIVLALSMMASTTFAQGQHDHTQHQQHTPAIDSSQTPSHVAPEPPTHVLEPMSTEQMHQMMEMDDSAAFGSVVFDRAEWHEQNDALAWNGSAWYGGDYNKLVLKSEGETENDQEHVRSEALWDRVIGTWWNLQTGIRFDSGTGPTRTWAAIGIEGLAPNWIDVESTLYIADEGRTALRVELRHDFRVTQRLILQPQLEANAYGKSDAQRRFGSGLADLETGLRLRYEFRREFAPYVGVQWTSLFGRTADYARDDGSESDEFQFVAGVRFWF
jgi:copper resistance protein B